MQLLATCIGGLVGALLLAGAAPAEERLALLIGNADYPAEVGRLTLPHDDVATLKDALEAVGFSVASLFDADEDAMEAAIADFADQLDRAGPDTVGFFYYSGHGASTSVAGRRRNFLLPAREAITSGAQLAIRGVRLDEVVDTLGASQAKAIFVVADACRNTLAWSDSRGGDRGFAVESARSGVIVAQSTAPEETAPDDGVFARALAAQIRVPGQYYSRTFELAYREVDSTRDRYRQPTTQGSLREDFCFAGCEGAPGATPPADNASSGQSTDQLGADQQLFASLESPCEYAMFARDHPASSPAALARARAGGALPCDEAPVAPPDPCEGYRGMSVALPTEPDTVSWRYVGDMIDDLEFTGQFWNPGGEDVKIGGFRNAFRDAGPGNALVADCATGLMWEGGTSGPFTLAQAHEEVSRRNGAGYMGYTDWRVPTSAELASLTQALGSRTPNLTTDLHLDPAYFDASGYFALSADRVVSRTPGESPEGVLIVTWAGPGAWAAMGEDDSYPLKMVRTME